MLWYMIISHLAFEVISIQLGTQSLQSSLLFRHGKTYGEGNFLLLKFSISQL